MADVRWAAVEGAAEGAGGTMEVAGEGEDEEVCTVTWLRTPSRRRRCSCTCRAHAARRRLHGASYRRRSHRAST